MSIRDKAAKHYVWGVSTRLRTRWTCAGDQAPDVVLVRGPDERNVAGEAIKLRNDERGAMHPAGGECLLELRAV